MTTDSIGYKLAHACWITCDQNEIDKCLVEFKKKYGISSLELTCKPKSFLIFPAIRKDYLYRMRDDGFAIAHEQYDESYIDFRFWVTIVVTEQIISKQLEALENKLIEKYFTPGNKGALDAEEEFKNISTNLR